MIIRKTLNLKDLRKHNPEFVDVSLVKSIISSRWKHKQTVRALGLGKLNTKVRHRFTSEIAGMLQQVGYLLEIATSKDPIPAEGKKIKTEIKKNVKNDI